MGWMRGRPPEAFEEWVWARTGSEAIRLLSGGTVTEVSISSDDRDTARVLSWLEGQLRAGTLSGVELQFHGADDGPLDPEELAEGGEGASERAVGWERFLDEATGFVDAGGNHLDQGIQRTVAALRALGFPTQFSCEGHDPPRTDFFGPWVIVAPAATEHHSDRVPRAMHETVALLRDRLERLVDLYHRYHAPLRGESALIVGGEGCRVLLDQEVYWCACILRSAGAHPGSAFVTSEPAALQVLRQEMERFSDFARAMYIRD